MNNDSQRIQSLVRMNDTQAKTIHKQRKEIEKLRAELERVREKSWEHFQNAERFSQAMHTQIEVVMAWREAHRQLAEAGKAKR